MRTESEAKVVTFKKGTIHRYCTAAVGVVNDVIITEAAMLVDS